MDARGKTKTRETQRNLEKNRPERTSATGICIVGGSCIISTRQRSLAEYHQRPDSSPKKNTDISQSSDLNLYGGFGLISL